MKYIVLSLSVLFCFSLFAEEKVDKVCLVSNGFVNTMIQEPKITKVLPVAHEFTEK